MAAKKAVRPGTRVAHQTLHALWLLSAGRLTTGELAETLDVSRDTAERILHVFRESPYWQLITEERGSERLHRVQPK
jgi:hypothetical protein